MDLLNKSDANLRYLLIGALIPVILVGMQAVSYLINMIVISLILAMLGTPILYFFKNRGLSDVISVTLIMFLYGAIIVGFIALIFESVNVFLADLPEYEELFTVRIQEISSLMGGLGISGDMISSLYPDWSIIPKIAIQIAGGISSLLMDGFFIVVITCFLLLEIPALPKRMKRVTGGDDNITEKYQDMCNNMIQWMVVKTKTNIVLGASFGAMLYAMGINLAIFWGVMAIILSYIPYIGLFIVAVPAVILAWLQLGIWGALIVIVGICIINAVVENVVFSKFAEKSFNMPPLVVILSLVLWTWVLGPIGMLISVPFTIMILIALKYGETTKWIPEIMGMDEIKNNKPDKKALKTSQK
ncbi:MAG: AI-2E family transporter [Methanomicrobiaceae archaeon]|nr:AI-2E family transporter [Methanomicrobiaceae archaeon]